MQGQSNLFQIILALKPGGRLPDLLDGWQQQTHQNCDDGDDDEQFDQCEATTAGMAADHDQSTFRTGERFTIIYIAGIGVVVLDSAIEYYAPRLSQFQGV